MESKGSPSVSFFSKQGVGRSLPLITGNPATVDGGRSEDSSSTGATSWEIVKSVAMNLFGDGTCRAGNWADSHSSSSVSSMVDTQNSVPNRLSTCGSLWSNKLSNTLGPTSDRFSDSSVASDPEVSSATPAMTRLMQGSQKGKHMASDGRCIFRII